MGSTPANGIKSIDDIFLRLVHFVERIIGKDRFLLAGSSCGGALAIGLSQQFRSQIDGLLLRVPLIESDNSKRDLDSFQPIISNPELISQLTPQEKNDLGNILIQTPEYLSKLRQKINDTVLPAIQASDFGVLGPIRSDKQLYKLSAKYQSNTDKFLAPTLILCGRQDDDVGYRDSIRLLQQYPRATFAVLDRETHALPLDDQGLFKALVLNWINRVNEWIIGKG
ncbi:hypothetical protein L7F22_067886 [Adiantum nelumboides]|nr:hypothetical protein [Adiantum nelumboides]